MNHSIKDIFSNKPTREKEEDLYKVKKVPFRKDDMRILEDLMKKSLRTKRSNESSSWKNFGHFDGGGSFADSIFNPKRQRVMFKQSFNPSKTVHKKYLNTYMPQENKDYVVEKPELFGTPEDEYNENMSAYHYKWILSPENQNVDLKLLAEQFIKRVEEITGQQLYWRGCIHNDTAHRHAHLCINGKDKNGLKVRFQKELVKTTFRETLSYISTLMVGERSEQEIEAARKGLINSKRWTKLDDVLETFGKTISIKNLEPELVNRLAYLSELKLAEKHEDRYVLKDDWKDVLVATGRYNTYFDEWQKSNGNLELYAGGTVRGVCENVITFDKDEAWNDAIIINDGEKHIYVPIWQLTKDNLIGKEIAISGGTKALARQIRTSDIYIIEDDKKHKYRKNIKKQGE
ncbi:MAG: hypothetical protein K6C98_02695 [Treponema sp.]|nr:hypothetical protein [Treponema sp.]